MVDDDDCDDDYDESEHLPPRCDAFVLDGQQCERNYGHEGRHDNGRGIVWGGDSHVDPPRCESEYGGYHCLEDVGHAGPHDSGTGLFWADGGYAQVEQPMPSIVLNASRPDGWTPDELVKAADLYEGYGDGSRYFGAGPLTVSRTDAKVIALALRTLAAQGMKKSSQ